MIVLEIKLANRSLYNLLEVAAERKEPIITEINHRKLGKTKALIEFARDNNYTVLVGNGTIAKMLIKEYGYRQIKSIKSNVESYMYFVYDECCHKEDISKLVNGGQLVLTGFQKNDDFYPESR